LGRTAVDFRADEEIGRDLAAVDWESTPVIDCGTRKPERTIPGANRGRGIILMRGLVEDLTIHSTESGTTVHLYSRIA
jgi:hypothetical protein